MNRTGMWAAAVLAVALPVGGFFVAPRVVELVGGPSSRVESCERVLADVIGRVPGVLSVAVECSFQFGGGWQRQTVRLDATSADAAYPIVELLLRSLAQDPEVASEWSTPHIYELTSGDTLRSLDPLGFNGPPRVGDVRTHYGIEPR